MVKKKKTTSTQTPYWKREVRILECECGTPCKVGIDTVKVTCWKCVNKLVDPPEFMKPDPRPDMPKGWRKRKQYVHTDGSVFEYGEEKPELYGTITPKPTKTIVKAKKEKVKINKLPVNERSEARTTLLKELQFLKQEQTRAINSKDSKRVSKKIEFVTKQLMKIK